MSITAATQQTHDVITVGDGTRISLQDWGSAACRLQSWLAPQRRCVGRSDGLSRSSWLSMHRARSPRPRTVEPTVERQRDGDMR